MLKETGINLEWIKDLKNCINQLEKADYKKPTPQHWVLCKLGRRNNNEHL